MIHIRSRNMHGALQELCRAVSPADVIDMGNSKPARLSRLREPVGITLHSPMERMVEDQQHNPLQWYDALYGFLPEFSRVPDPAEMFAPERWKNQACTFDLESWRISIRADRGHIDMVVYAGPLHLCSIAEHAFILTHLQEYIAIQHELPMGIFDFVLSHVTLPEGMEYVERFAKMPADENPYQISSCLPGQMDKPLDKLLLDAGAFPAIGLTNRWVRRELGPMLMALAALNEEDGPDVMAANRLIQSCQAGDASRTARLWLESAYPEGPTK